MRPVIIFKSIINTEVSTFGRLVYTSKKHQRMRGVVCVLTALLFAGANVFAQVTVDQRTSPNGLKPASVVSNDFNQDSRKDIAVAAYDEKAIVLHLGNADTSFSAPVHV